MCPCPPEPFEPVEGGNLRVAIKAAVRNALDRVEVTKYFTLYLQRAIHAVARMLLEPVPSASP